MEELQHRGQDIHESSARTELPGQNCLDRTARTGQPRRDWKYRTAMKKNARKGHPGHVSQDRTARIGQLEQGNHHAQDHQDISRNYYSILYCTTRFSLHVVNL